VKPGRIQVFDGLRVATEHIDHMQDALHSSIEDLREVIGLGRVLHGFEVQPEGDQAIVVGPGLAFDNRRNRVVVDEPKRLDVTFPAGQDTRYVCARYEEVEDGEVEGRSTLLWDSTAVVLADTLPAPEDDLVPIAKLVRGADDGFEIVQLGPPSPPDGEGEEAAPTDAAPEATPAPAEGAAAPLRVAQGVLDLSQAAATEPGPLPAMAAALRARAAGAEETGDVRVVLGATEVPLKPPPAALSFATSLSATLQAADGARGHGQATSQGEATLANGTVAQFGLATLHLSRRPEPDPVVPWRAAELTEGSIARLPVGAVAAEGLLGDDQGVLEQLHLAVEATAAAPSGFGVSCVLVWRGDIVEERIAALEASSPVLSWSASIGWKAVSAG
jgi:hypothetical protein